MRLSVVLIGEGSILVEVLVGVVVATRRVVPVVVVVRGRMVERVVVGGRIVERVVAGGRIFEGVVERVGALWNGAELF